jgi:polyhydroxybutyrate depolymerase
MTVVAAASIGVARADIAPADPVPDAPEDIAPSVGCSAAPARSGTYTFRHGKVTRTYAVSLPKAYDGRQPMRLVVAFHSWGGDEREFVGEPGVVAASSERNYILVAARGLGAGAPDHQKSSWTFRGSATGVIDDGDKRLPICDLALTPDDRYPSCRKGTAVNHCSWTQCQDDDVAFVVALVERLDKTLCVDTHHTYAAGGFTGGMFIWSLGADERSARLFRAQGQWRARSHRRLCPSVRCLSGTQVRTCKLSQYCRSDLDGNGRGRHCRVHPSTGLQLVDR